VVTVSPNNPTGAVYPAATLRAVNELCRARDIFHVHDQAYEYFDHTGVPALSPASLPGSAGHTLSLFSLSKAYGFASWRIGAMVLPAALLSSVKKIQDTNLICPPVMSQLAACAALDAGRAYCAPFVAELGRTREVFRRALDRIADLADVPDAPGAFYSFVRVRAAIDPMRLVERLIREHKVAVMPGSAFGVDDECAVRLSYGALAPETAAAGVERFVTGLRAIVG
jgi:aspartate/methionine/tyrosine aminotransferase